jgi:ADP-ribose pyrophosphatase
MIAARILGFSSCRICIRINSMCLQKCGSGGQRLMDEDLVEQKISSQNVYDGKLLHVKCDQVRLPNGREAAREWIQHPGAAAVLPVLPDGRIVLVRQYRYPIQAVTLEIPAGKMDVVGEDPLGCAKRELQEETGYTATIFTPLITLATTVGFSNERIHLFLARGLTAGEASPDEDEFIHVVRIPLTDAVQMVYEGQIVDAKSITAILLLSAQSLHT